MRINGSILGPYQLIGSGVYSITEANLLKSEGSWKPSSYPTAYISLIDTFSLENRIYVETYTQLVAAINAASAVTQTAIILSGDTFIPGGGEALTLNMTGTGASAVVADLGKPISFICAPGQTIIQWTAATTSRDGPMVYFANASSAIYGAYLKRDNNGKTLNYSTAFVRSAGGLGYVYNCIFREMNANNNWSRNYAPSGANSYQINYTSIYVNANGLSDFSSSAGASWNYCTNNYAKGSGTTPWLNSAENVTYNSNFSITGNTTQGVYAGTYAWDPLMTYITTAS
jgi:hypothetical protein